MTLPDRDALRELASLALFAVGGIFCGYTAMAGYEADSAVSARVHDGEPVAATLEAHVRVDRVAADAGKLLAQVESFYEGQGRWPASGDLKQPVPLAYADLGSLVRQYEISDAGHVRATLAGPGLDGRAVVFVPRIGPHRVLGWSCVAPAELLDWLRPACPE